MSRVQYVEVFPPPSVSFLPFLLRLHVYIHAVSSPSCGCLHYTWTYRGHHTRPPLILTLVPGPLLPVHRLLLIVGEKHLHSRHTRRILHTVQPCVFFLHQPISRLGAESKSRHSALSQDNSYTFASVCGNRHCRMVSSKDFLQPIFYT